jgi:dipeptidase E
MGKIVAIGGGELRDRDTMSIDKHILELTGKTNPRFLFIPTASNDAEGYVTTVKQVYGNELGSEVDVLRLVNENPTQSEIEDKILSSDAIYVGGGNTQRMLDIWKVKGVDRVLKEAFDKGIVLSGLSAGAICWFEFGSTDSPSFDNPEDKDFVLLNGLGFVKGLVSPHHIREPERIKRLPGLVKESGSVGLGLDDNSALEIIDGEFRVISSKEGVSVSRVYFNEDGDLQIEKVSPSREFRSYLELIDNTSETKFR